MKEGDILLIFARFDPIAFIIRKATHSLFNHVAWALSKDKLLEVKSIKGIVTTPSIHYKNKFLYRTKLVRIKNISKYRLQKAIYYAIAESITVEDKGYFKFLLNLASIAQKQNLPKRTCSNFISEALSYVGWRFNCNKKPEYIIPEDINNSQGVRDVTKEF